MVTVYEMSRILHHSYFEHTAGALAVPAIIIDLLVAACSAVVVGIIIATAVLAVVIIVVALEVTSDGNFAAAIVEIFPQ